MFQRKRRPPAVAVLVFGLLAAGIRLVGDAPAGAGAARGQPGVDRHGDPLPPGATARLGTVRLRHAGEVRGVVFAPDGKAVASVGEGPAAVRIWDVSTGRELRRLSAE